MKLTNKQLKRIIKEEVQKALNERRTKKLPGESGGQSLRDKIAAAVAKSTAKKAKVRAWAAKKVKEDAKKAEKEAGRKTERALKEIAPSDPGTFARSRPSRKTPAAAKPSKPSEDYEFTVDDMVKWQRQQRGKDARINACMDKCSPLCPDRSRRCMSKCKEWCYRREDRRRAGRR